MKTGKQVWCFLLALALILGLFPTAAQPVQAMDNAGGATNLATATETAEANPVVRFTFADGSGGEVTNGMGSIWVNGEDMGTEVEVEPGSDLKFRVKVPGYWLRAVLLNERQPLTADSNGEYTVPGVIKNESIRIMITKQLDSKSLFFDATDTKVMINGIDYASAEYSVQYNDWVTFFVKPNRVGATVSVTSDKCAITDNGDGSYTIFGVTDNATVTVRAEGGEQKPRNVTFQCVNAKVTVNEEDYTGGVYSYLEGQFVFDVEISEGYYVKAVSASADCKIINLSELQEGKTSYYLPDFNEDLTITVVAEEGQENTWPLEYQYTYQDLREGEPSACIAACAPTYSGALEIDYAIHNGVRFPITTIGDYAFAECYELTEVVMGDTVSQIEEDAFLSSAIRHIRLSENVKEIPSECFRNCFYLEEIDIPEGVTLLGKFAFQDCPSLRSVTLPKSLRTVKDSVFSSCKSLKEIVIPDGIDDIPELMFSGCTSLENVVFQGSVSSIGRAAFYKTAALESIQLPKNLTDLGSAAFEDSGLKEIMIPGGIAEIKERTFFGCKNLKSVTFLNSHLKEIGKSAFYGTGLQSIILPDGLLRIGDEAFRESTLMEIQIPRDCTEIGRGAFWGTLIKEFRVASENQAFAVGEDGVLFSKDGKRLILYPNGRNARIYAVPLGVERIEENAFYGEPNLEEVTFPESLRDFGDRAFYGLPNLKRLVLPEGLEDITGTSVFCKCEGLEELKLPSTLRDISGELIFSKTGITDLTLPESMGDITGKRVFSSCPNLKRVIFPDNMKIISGSFLFIDCPLLSDVVFPEKLEAITGSSILSGTGLESVTFPTSLKELGDSTFASCASLKEVQLPEGLQILGDESFRNCTLLQSIALPEELESIGAGAFMDCSSLEEIHISNGVKQIGDCCFLGCEMLSEVTLPESLESLGSYAFCETDITELQIPASLAYFGNLPIGGKQTFYPTGVVWVYDTEHAYTLYFAGDMPEWEPNPIPNLPSTCCYFPRENSTWTENLRNLLDGLTTYRIRWLATDVTLPESVELIAGFGKQLTAQVRPADDPNLALTWTSSDETVVQVDETGMCTGIAPGTAVITASAGGGAYSAQCQVTVLENSAPHYEDVPESAWYYEAVQYTSAHGLFQGMTETKFGPNLTMTRGMLVTVLYRMEGEPAVEGQTHPFTDVDASRYYGDAITWAANSGVVNGMTDTRFAPEAAVTREQMVTILYRYAKLKGADVTAKGELESFPDHDQVKPYARDAFSWAVGAGIIQGDSNGSVATLSPRNSATRAQVAAVLMRYLEQLG